MQSGDKMRLVNLAFRREIRHHHMHLKRRCQNIPLADRSYICVTKIPSFVFNFFFPRLIGKNPCTFTFDINPKFLPKPKSSCGGCEFFYPYPTLTSKTAPHSVKKGIA